MAKKESAYAAKGLFRYSPGYYAWRKAVVDNRDSGDIRELSEAHMLRFLGREYLAGVPGNFVSGPIPGLE